MRDSILRSLKLDPQGFIHLGGDGVARSFTGNASVIDFVKFTPDQLNKVGVLPGEGSSDRDLGRRRWSRCGQ